jgi:hypothetical protein
MTYWRKLLVAEDNTAPNDEIIEFWSEDVKGSGCALFT